MFRSLQLLGWTPGGMWVLAQSLRSDFFRRLPMTFSWLAKRPLDKVAYDSQLMPLRRSQAVRRDVAKVVRAIRPEYTMQASYKLPHFDRPVLIVWPKPCRVFPYTDAERLAQLLPDAELHAISDCYAYVPEDRPEVLAGHIDAFLARISADEGA
jgi:pimeloyl-ACP methyl ester carboxylesterase